MKRDLDLIREMLLKMEQDNDFQIDKELSNTELAHLILLKEAGLVDASIEADGSGHVYSYLYRPTWQGYDFLNSIKDIALFEKIKKAFKEKSVDWTISLVKAYALYILKDKLGIKEL